MDRWLVYLVDVLAGPLRLLVVIHRTKLLRMMSLGFLPAYLATAMQEGIYPFGKALKWIWRSPNLIQIFIIGKVNILLISVTDRTCLDNARFVSWMTASINYFRLESATTAVSFLFGLQGTIFTA